ncbi:hypothetical protein FNV43_RR21765 [Rhamnella rubrinervis]|uniref:Uncharacterized protein n=1 Tax=Rhamnella rubrinervis TaxID=2594499 RepID=A0A8K0GUI1_9ROSA|nr:hypothetical protein FNV43_RR21765 [Rhamnella rubrinervis]
MSSTQEELDLGREDLDQERARPGEGELQARPREVGPRPRKRAQLGESDPRSKKIESRDEGPQPRESSKLDLRSCSFIWTMLISLVYVIGGACKAPSRCSAFLTPRVSLKSSLSSYSCSMNLRLLGLVSRCTGSSSVGKPPGDVLCKFSNKVYEAVMLMGVLKLISTF